MRGRDARFKYLSALIAALFVALIAALVAVITVFLYYVTSRGVFSLLSTYQAPYPY